MITYHYPLILNSSTDSGAINKAANGSAFQVALERPILIPSEAVYCWCVCQAAEVWNTSPNIITGVNDKLYIKGLSGTHTFTIPEGLYDIDLLNSEINRQALAASLPSDFFVIFGNAATQKTTIQLLAVGTEIDFTTDPDTFKELLGFTADIGPSIDINQLFDSQEVAAFNQIDYYVLHTDVVTHGIQINTRKSQAVAQILITAPSGDQIIHQPDNPPEIPANELIGTKKNLINVWLTNQDNVRVSTAGEDFSCRLMFYYLIPWKRHQEQIGTNRIHSKSWHGIHR